MKRLWNYIIGKEYYVVVFRSMDGKRYLSKDEKTWVDNLEQAKRFFSWFTVSGGWRYGVERISHHKCLPVNDWKFEWGEYVRCKRCWICSKEITTKQK